MGDLKSDLWSEFEDENVDDEFAGKLKALHKKSDADGSEWAGKFDRRTTPRDEDSNSAGNDDQDPKNNEESGS